MSSDIFANATFGGPEKKEAGEKKTEKGKTKKGGQKPAESDVLV